MFQIWTFKRHYNVDQRLKKIFQIFCWQGPVLWCSHMGTLAHLEVKYFKMQNLQTFNRVEKRVSRRVEAECSANNYWNKSTKDKCIDFTVILNGFWAYMFPESCILRSQK